MALALHYMTQKLNCLRCSSEMQLGTISQREQLYPDVWRTGESKEPEARFRILSKDEAARKNDERKASAASLMYVDAYRCNNCGYTELSSTRKVATTQGEPPYSGAK